MSTAVQSTIRAFLSTKFPATPITRCNFLLIFKTLLDMSQLWSNSVLFDSANCSFYFGQCLKSQRILVFNTIFSMVYTSAQNRCSLKTTFSSHSLFTKMPATALSIAEDQQQFFTDSLSLKDKTSFLRVGGKHSRCQ